MEKLNYTLANLNVSELNVFKSIFDYNEVRSSLSSYKGKSCESHYIRVYGFRYWDLTEMNNLSKLVNLFNSKCKSSEMVIIDYQDYEVEYDNDRSYPASFTFSIIPK
jgi:hypothetical protein